MYGVKASTSLTKSSVTGSQKENVKILTQHDRLLHRRNSKGSLVRPGKAQSGLLGSYTASMHLLSAYSSEERLLPLAPTSSYEELECFLVFGFIITRS